MVAVQYIVTVVNIDELSFLILSMVGGAELVHRYLIAQGTAACSSTGVAAITDHEGRQKFQI